MNIFEAFFINIILLLFPLICYFLFIAHQKSCGQKAKELLLDLSLYSSIYLILKYGSPFLSVNIILITIPLFISYLKKRVYSIILISITIGLYYFGYHFNICLIILELLSYFMVFMISYNEKNFRVSMFNFFSVIRISFILLNSDSAPFYKLDIFYLIVIFVFFYLTLQLISYVYIKGEASASLRMSVREMEKQKQLRESLFKITHEIKNPLAVCKGYLDMFDVDNKSHAEKYIPIIKQEIDRTLNLMNDFLNLTKLKINKINLDVSVVLQDTCESLKMLMKAHDINFKYDILDEELYLIGDYDRLKQVFINIMKNAIEAIPAKQKGIIEFSTKCTKDNLIISIKDNGIGINEEILKKIGEPFYTTKKNGTGLGVCLSKEIIEAHMGTITYKSKINVGTTVTILLPILKNP